MIIVIVFIFSVISLESALPFSQTKMSENKIKKTQIDYEAQYMMQAMFETISVSMT